MYHLCRTHFKLAKTAIRANRTRSFLTCLGIAIGVASIVLILSLTGSIRNLVQDEVSNIGQDLIVVRPSSTKDTITSIVEELTSASAFQRSTLTLDDVLAIRDLDNISSVAPIATSLGTVASDKNTLSSVTFLGTTSDFITIEPFALRYGSFLSNYEGSSTKSVVLGRTLSLTLFNTMSSTVGQTITIMGEKFVIVGVLDSVDQSISFDNIDFDNALIMSASNLRALTDSLQIQQINIKAATTSDLAQTSTDISQALTASRQGDQNFSVAYGDAITHPAGTLFSIVSSMLTLVAAISLIVGGVGVMNIMLVSVSERTHEIGIRKSVGASSYNILMQFLFESLIISLLGGIMGLVLGYVIAFLISIITPFAPFVSWQILGITFAIALIVGTLFGIYPAIKAAAKNPIDSLKHYR